MRTYAPLEEIWGARSGAHAFLSVKCSAMVTLAFSLFHCGYSPTRREPPNSLCKQSRGGDGRMAQLKLGVCGAGHTGERAAQASGGEGGQDPRRHLVLPGRQNGQSGGLVCCWACPHSVNRHLWPSPHCLWPAAGNARSTAYHSIALFREDKGLLHPCVFWETLLQHNQITMNNHHDEANTANSRNNRSKADGA